MSENDITKDILDASIKIHKQFGPGMLESVYEQLLAVELKSTEHMQPVYLKQVKTYLVVMGLQVGVLVNFGMNQLKDGYVRVVNGYTGPKPSQQ